LPALSGGELTHLAEAVERMRTELEGKAYVERYVHSLTHEQKSPLAANRGAAELRGGDMAEEQRKRFDGNIAQESARLQQLIERLLHLAQVEQRQGLEERVVVPLQPLVESLLQGQLARIQRAGLRVENLIPQGLSVPGERFLLRQALSNLLDNALDFTPSGGLIRFAANATGEQIEVRVFNQAEPIPDYALGRLCERFYSLPRPANGRKSTGLGLNFVQEVLALHGGTLQIGNVERGVDVRLSLPRA
jgi:two-component system sensor histidine kinase CreC